MKGLLNTYVPTFFLLQRRLQIPVLLWFNNRTEHISTSRSVVFRRPTHGAGLHWGYQAWMNCHFRKVPKSNIPNRKTRTGAFALVVAVKCPCWLLFTRRSRLTS